ncbi:hypothetical protein [Parabacteroides sp. FAFU027]|uniref:hypothetical protein n=1 Tax=Parabacteroides sp. FAFU027 TaxID=2922715 RepID=UPI001FAF8976|nr:hypothetical protein [Parabacteroides sp. FAFU027]
MTDITLEKIQNALRKKGYKIFENDTKPYNLNIVGIRSINAKPNSFDDWITVMWKYKGNWNLVKYEATTDPGLFWLENPGNPLGTAILKEGQYPGSHQLGLHQGKYKALVQIGNLTVIRDYDRDKQLDYNSGSEETNNNFGINIHRACLNGRSIQVDKWSAGCQVFADSFQFNHFMDMCNESAKILGNKFTYTLLNKNDL